ncbi:cytochrome c biogenesis protein ResB [Parvibium lacunae]|uniref:Cytochrome c biogenesis protein ResB n=2 Tax=Parvibium lacunae TaxID=1888893 RepID=A0A368L0T4_9BURK|nr:cytochrome c biogenesis protein ResB [Parvibium lacunae]
MRFAIASLTLIAIASIVGTVMKQNEPTPNYINQFGEFWYAIFDALSLYTVYTSTWFIAVLFLLILSTSLCILRNAPKMVKDALAWRDTLREGSLRAFGHHTEGNSSQPPAQLAQTLGQWLQAKGYRVKISERPSPVADAAGTEPAPPAAILLAAKRGATNRFGYIFAHSAIVLMGVGYLFDTDIPVKVQAWLFNKQPIQGAERISEVPESGRLSARNPSFRGNSLVPENGSTDVTIVSLREGLLVQELPFTLTLKKFRIDYYSTGMPKLFASDVELLDKLSGERIQRTIEVNKPLIHRGIAIYQANFDDGGSRLTLRAYPMQGAGQQTLTLSGTVGQVIPLSQQQGKPYQLELTGFRPINVEKIDPEVNPEDSAVTGQSRGLRAQLGSAAKTANDKHLRNIGPSIQYKLRDAAGQAIEFHNYMLPVQMEGAVVYLAGLRQNPNDAFRYLRIPADPQGGLDEFMRLRAAVANPALRELAARQFAQNASRFFPAERASAGEATTQLTQSALNLLTTFAGANTALRQASTEPQSGLQAVAELVERTIPAAEQPRMVEVLLKMLEGSMWELWQVARQADRLPAVSADETNGLFLRRALNAVSDSLLYAAPVYFQLTDFDHVQASGFQMTRSPGKPWVYLGCLLLVLGVFAMFYVRERRLWILVKPVMSSAETASEALLAFSAARRGLDFEDEFVQIRQDFAQLLAVKETHGSDH